LGYSPTLMMRARYSSETLFFFGLYGITTQQYPLYMSRFGVLSVTYKTGSGLDDWIYCTLYIHTARDYRQYSAIADLHTLGWGHTSARSTYVATHILHDGRC
jgi:hypothetical protein